MSSRIAVEDDLVVTIEGFEDPSTKPARSPAAANYRLVTLGMAASDVISLLSALLLAHMARFGLTALPSDYIWVVLMAPVTWLVIFHAYGLYAPQHLSPTEEFRRVIGATSVAVIAIAMLSVWSDAWSSRGWVGAFWLFALVLEMIARREWRRKIGRLRGAGHLSMRTLIVGTDGDAGRVAKALDDQTAGFETIGFVAVTDIYTSPNGLPVVCRLQDLQNVIQSEGVDCLFVASSALNGSDMAAVLGIARRHGVEVRVSSHLSEILTSRVCVQPVGSIMALSLRPVQLTGAHSALKNIFDVLTASALLLALAPLLVAVALAVRLTSRGPALFRQQRTTKDGRPFTMYKFRTMSPKADSLLAQTVDTSAPFFKLDKDPRLTPVGRFLRRTSLDELPQLLNVIRGDMSLVGPRPLPIEQFNANRELLAPRLEVRAGVTGWWQINGRSDLSPEQALGMDLFYVENWSLSLDLYILAKTLGAVLGRRGAR